MFGLGQLITRWGVLVVGVHEAASVLADKAYTSIAQPDQPKASADA